MGKLIEQLVHFEFPEIVIRLDRLTSHARANSGLITESGYLVYPDEDTDDAYSNDYHFVQECTEELIETEVGEIRQHTIEMLHQFGYRVDLEQKIISSKSAMFSYF